MATYIKREISEWNTSDLSRWLIDNKYPGISELCQNNSISGYDLFYITDDILKNELGLNSFHERKVTMKLIKKLIYEHLKLNIINSNGDSVILTLDNNQETSLGELSEYIGGMFNMEPKDILYKDSTKKEVLSPTLKIVKLLILYPHLYKTLNVFNMKDYHQISENNNNSNENENENVYQNNDNNIAVSSENENESEGQEMDRMNYNYKKIGNEDLYNMEEIPQKRIDYNENRERERERERERANENIKNMQINGDYNPKNNKNHKYRSEQRIYRGNRNINENEQIENSDEIDSDYKNNRIIDDDFQYRNKTNYRDNSDKFNKEFYSMRNKGAKIMGDNSGQRNYNKIYKNVDIKEDYYNSALN